VRVKVNGASVHSVSWRAELLKGPVAGCMAVWGVWSERSAEGTDGVLEMRS
jgi:hypothetical protein